MNDVSLVIMAAGLGSRFGAPKQLVPVGPKNEIFLDYAIREAIELEIKKIGDEQIPFVQIRNNIEGFISRSVYYSLIEIALMQDNGSSELLTLKSFDCNFELGEMSD